MSGGAGGSLVPRRMIAVAVLLTVVFTVLRVTGVTGWSWWLVLSPVWVFTAAGAGVLFVLAVAWVARWWM